MRRAWSSPAGGGRRGRNRASSRLASAGDPATSATRGGAGKFLPIDLRWGGGPLGEAEWWRGWRRKPPLARRHPSVNRLERRLPPPHRQSMGRIGLAQPVDVLVADRAGDDHQRAGQLARMRDREVADQRAGVAVGGGAEDQRRNLGMLR